MSPCHNTTRPASRGVGRRRCYIKNIFQKNDKSNKSAVSCQRTPAALFCKIRNVGNYKQIQKESFLCLLPGSHSPPSQKKFSPGTPSCLRECVGVHARACFLNARSAKRLSIRWLFRIRHVLRTPGAASLQKNESSREFQEHCVEMLRKLRRLLITDGFLLGEGLFWSFRAQAVS